MKNLLLLLCIFIYSVPAYSQLCIGEGSNNLSNELVLTPQINGYYGDLKLPIDKTDPNIDLGLYVEDILTEANSISYIPIQVVNSITRTYKYHQNYRYSQVYNGDTLLENFIVFTIDNDNNLRRLTISLALDTPSLDTNTFVPDTSTIQTGIPSSSSFSMKVNKPYSSTCSDDNQLEIDELGLTNEHVFRTYIDPPGKFYLSGKYAISAENLEFSGINYNCTAKKGNTPTTDEEKNFIRQNMYFYTPVQNK